MLLTIVLTAAVVLGVAMVLLMAIGRRVRISSRILGILLAAAIAFGGADDRVHLVCSPMEDEDEAAALVNALQRRGDVVVQKSLAEGFGLVISESMWKERPVVSARVGGIQDQIAHERSGLLVDDPSDGVAFAQSVLELLGDPKRAREMGSRARERVLDRFLAPRQLTQTMELVGELL